MTDERTFEMSCIFLHETHNAVQIRDPATDEEVWLPLSLVAEMHKNADHTGTIVMAEWIARKKGLC